MLTLIRIFRILASVATAMATFITVILILNFVAYDIGWWAGVIVSPFLIGAAGIILTYILEELEDGF